MKRRLLLALVMISAVLLFSCDELDNLIGQEDDDSGANSGVDFSGNPSNYSIRVTNSTPERLVAFKNELNENTLIGGIPARETAHGLKKDPALFGSKTESFILILITEKQYTDNKTNLKNLDQTPFTRLFAFFNANGTNETIYEISNRLGGNCTIEIQNMSPLDVELRLNEKTGETLGFARSESLRTQLYVIPGDYMIFPVFKKYNALKDEVITVYPRDANGFPWYTQRQLGADNQYELSLDVTKVLQDIEFSTGTAWLIIDNQATDTGIQLQRGDIVQRTSTGISTINNGYSRNFQIDMAKIADGKYAPSTNINAYKVGRMGQMLDIGNYDLEVDKVYKVTVTGSFTGGTAAVSEPVFQNNVDISDFDIPQ